MAWASISGFNSILDSNELTDRAVSSMLPTGPNMWCASLISGLFATNLPGPGCSLTNVSLAFHNLIRVGERIIVKVQVTAKEDSTKSLTFDCKARNSTGTSIFSGTAQLIAPLKSSACPHSRYPNSL